MWVPYPITNHYQYKDGVKIIPSKWKIYFKKYFPSQEMFLQLELPPTNCKKMERNWKLKDIKKYFGIHAMMGCMKFPQIRLYWSTKFKFPVIANGIPRDKFYLLIVNLHVVDVCTVSEKNKKIIVSCKLNQWLI